MDDLRFHSIHLLRLLIPAGSLFRVTSDPHTLTLVLVVILVFGTSSAPAFSPVRRDRCCGRVRRDRRFTLDPDRPHGSICHQDHIILLLLPHVAVHLYSAGRRSRAIRHAATIPPLSRHLIVMIWMLLLLEMRLQSLYLVPTGCAG